MEAKAPWGSVYLLAMDPGQGGLAGHLNATPDGRFNTQQGDGELVNRRPWRHAGKLLGHLTMGIPLEATWWGRAR